MHVIKQNLKDWGCHFADDIFKFIVLYDIYYILIKICSKGSINNKP